MKQLLITTILFFTITILPAQQVLKFNSNKLAYSTKNQKTNQWNEWSDWVPANNLIVFNLNNLRLNLFNRDQNGKETSIDIIKLLKKRINEKEKNTVLRFEGIDEDGKKILVEFVTKSDIENSYRFHLGSDQVIIIFSIKSMN